MCGVSREYPDKMAAPWRRVLNPSLETQPWKFFCIDGKTFLAKGYFTESSYSVLLTDLGVMWEEFIDEDNLLERSKVGGGDT